jgi:hypothetical protein
LKAKAGPKRVDVTFKRPGLVTGFVTVLVWRVDGGAPFSLDAFNKRVLVGETSDTSITDTRVTGGKTYTYFAQTKTASGEFSDRSNSFTVFVAK